MNPRALLFAMAALPAAGAWAHAFLEHAKPPVGSSVASAPAQVSLQFTQRLEPAFSRVQVLDPAGKRVDRDDAKVAADDPTTLVVSLSALGPGRYVVKWRVLSVDTHVTEGDYAFTVQP
jgi:methionine-rich copper-binding protein CopC